MGYKRSNSGDLPLLRCDKSQLTSSRQVGVALTDSTGAVTAGKAIVGHVPWRTTPRLSPPTSVESLLTLQMLPVVLRLETRFARATRSALSLQPMLRGFALTVHSPRTASRTSLSWVM